ILFPLLPSSYALGVLIDVLIFGLFAMSLDLLLGYTGLVSFGHAAFFGVGAYVAGIVGIYVGPEIYFTLPAALGAAALAALVIGYFSIRTTGVYFLMLTLAFSQMVYAAAFKAPFAGGSNGLAGIPRPTLGFGLGFTDSTAFYYLVLAILLLSYLILARLVASPFGKSLRGIKENESRMRSIGYNVQRYKLAAFVIAGAFAGLAGALRAQFNFFVAPDTMYWTTSGIALVMVIIGGAGTLIGPVLGAALVQVLQNLISSYTERWPLLLGAIFILFVLRAPKGMMGIAEQVKSAKAKGKSET
ncbi:MAG TPA: branched-chain amino acid ABC transporter permease, partial [Anaerolineae bacterium]